MLRALGEWDAVGACADEGTMHPVGWLAEHGSMTRRDASDLLRSARLVHEHPRTAKSLAAGDVSAANVKLLARAVRDREVGVRGSGATRCSTRQRSIAPEQFRRLARRWQSLADDDLDRAPAALQVDRWHLHASTTFDGAVALSGLLDPEGGAIVLAALDALDAPDPTDGRVRVRSLPQRRADALVALAQGTGGARRVNVDVLVDVGRLRGEAPTDLESFRRELVGIGPITQATLECLACDSNVGRIVMQGRSLVLDLGRRTPVVSPAQRRTLASTRRRLRRARLLCTARVVRRPPPRSLGAGWPDRSRQPRAAVPAPPSPGARRSAWSASSALTGQVIGPGDRPPRREREGACRQCSVGRGRPALGSAAAPGVGLLAVVRLVAAGLELALLRLLGHREPPYGGRPG